MCLCGHNRTELEETQRALLNGKNELNVYRVTLESEEKGFTLLNIYNLSPVFPNRVAGGVISIIYSSEPTLHENCIGHKTLIVNIHKQFLPAIWNLGLVLKLSLPNPQRQPALSGNPEADGTVCSAVGSEGTARGGVSFVSTLLVKAET